MKENEEIEYIGKKLNLKELLKKKRKDKTDEIGIPKIIIIMKNIKRYPISYLMLIQMKSEYLKLPNKLNESTKIENQSQKISETLNSRIYVLNRNKNRDNRRKIGKEDFGTKKQRKIKRQKNRHKSNLPRLVYFKPLKLSSNSWKVQHNKNVKHEEKMKRSTIILLNKLSIENINKLCPIFVEHILKKCEKVIDINIVVKTIFEKACEETSFSILYAKLCDYAQKNTFNEYLKENQNNVKNSEKNNKPIDIRTLFRRVIINLCQSNFYNQNSNEETEVKQIRRKKKILGNIKFVGDLFKAKLIHESIVHHIIWNFLKPNKNASEHTQTLGLEGCVKFFQTIGKEIDTKKTKRWIDQYFNYLKHYSKKNGTARIRFMVMDLFELRENRWKNKIQIDAIKTKEEVAAEFEESQQTKLQDLKKNNSTARKDLNGFKNDLLKAQNGLRKKIEFQRLTKIKKLNTFSNERVQKTNKLNFQNCFREKDNIGKKCSKKIDGEKAKKFLVTGNIENLDIYVKYMITDAGTKMFEDMLSLLREINRKKIFNEKLIRKWSMKFSKNIVNIQVEYDVPNGSKNFAKVLAEFFFTKKINLEDIVSNAKVFDKKNTKFRNEFVVEVLQETLRLNSKESQSTTNNLLLKFKEKANLIKSAFEFSPKLYNKPSRSSGVPLSGNCPLLIELLGKSYDKMFQLH